MLRRAGFMISLLLLIPPAFAAAESSLPLISVPGALAVSPSPSVSADSSEVKAFTIVVSRNGFNGSSAPLNIQVTQGDKVRIKFVYGDSDLRQDNPHVVKIEGYDIVTDEISKKYPVAIVEFTAGQVGKFRFFCSISCLGMDNLQSGTLEVNPPKLETSIRTVLEARHLEVHHPNIDHFLPHTDVLHVVAYVTSEKGRPVVGILVDFHVSTTFGLMKVASNTTEVDGSAHLLYPLSSLRKMGVTTYFKGSGAYEASNATGVFTPDISIVDPLETPYLSGQNPTIDLRVVGIEPQVGASLVAIIAVVVGSVWSTYVYVLGHVLKIKKHSSKRVRGGD